MSCNPSSLSAAIHNFNCAKPRYGKIKFIVEHFGISRSVLYRKSNQFIEDFCCGPGRPHGISKNNNVPELELKLEKLENENKQLKNTLQRVRIEHKHSIEKLIFMLIVIGLSGRITAWILKSAFNIQISHTTILKKAEKYAVKATVVMREHFHSVGVNVAVDEVFLGGLPIFLAVSPYSLLISNAAIYEKRTEENWTEFLNMMENLEGTVSDRGLSILAAVAKRTGHNHQSDVFHCMYTVMKQLLKMERHCYAHITKEEEAESKLNKRKRTGKDARKEACRLRAAKNMCSKDIELYDSLNQAVDIAFSAMSISNGCTLNNVDDARKNLDFVCEWINHIHPAWKKVISAFQDSHLLEYIKKSYTAITEIDVQCELSLDCEYVLAVLTYYWEKQASDRWRGKEVVLPETIEKGLDSICKNLKQVRIKLFEELEGIPKASSAVECVNSKFGFFRYSKKNFNNDFVNLISAVHNLTPFLDGKRKGVSPAELEGMLLADRSLFELFDVK